jgi:hypothetical protein
MTGIAVRPTYVLLMAEPSDEASPHRRATWVALRTLRQRPTVIGRTGDGETVFGIRSVRVVLRGDSPHFNRLAECSKCGRDVPGAPVLGPADLDQPSHPVICSNCVRSAPMPSWVPAPAPAPAVPPPVQVAAEPVHDGRLKALEAQLREVVTQLVAGADVQRSQGAAADATSAALTEVRAEVREMADGAAARAAATEAEVRRSVGSLTELVETQHRDMVALAGAVADTRSGVERVAESNRVLARVQHELHQRLLDTMARISAQPGADQLAEVNERDNDAARAALHGAVEAGLDRARSEVESLRDQVGAHVTALTHLVETQRTSIEALDDVVRTELSTVGQALHDLTKAGESVEDRLEDLDRKALDGEAQVHALRALAEAGASRVHALERKQASLQRLTRLLGAQAGARQVAGEGDAASVRQGTAGDPLDTLDRQLLAAEARLAERANPRLR